MFSLNAPIADDSVIRPIGDDDQRLLLGLVHKYGLSSLMCALTGLGESCMWHSDHREPWIRPTNL